MSKAFLSGKNCTIIAYGAHGTGKSHTLLGSAFDQCLELDQNQMELI